MLQDEDEDHCLTTEVSQKEKDLNSDWDQMTREDTDGKSMHQCD